MPYIIFALSFVLSSLVTAAILSPFVRWLMVLWLACAVLGVLWVYGLEWRRQGRWPTVMQFANRAYYEVKKLIEEG